MLLRVFCYRDLYIIDVRLYIVVIFFFLGTLCWEKKDSFKFGNKSKSVETKTRSY